VVDLSDAAVAGGADAAAAVAHEGRGALGGGGVAAEVHDGADVDAVADDELEERLPEQVAGDGERDRSDAVDLAHLVALDGAAVERFEVDEHDRLGRALPPVAAVRGAGPGDEAVGGVGVGGFVLACGAGLLEGARQAPARGRRRRGG
jgi:hypothetical protein